MKPHTLSIEIDLPREKVIELFEDPDNLAKWQSGFLSHEHLSGEPKHADAKSRITFGTPDQRIEFIETITEYNLPDNLSTTLQGPQRMNIAHHRFTEIGPNAERTRWACTVGYQLKGLKIRLMTIFNPGVFRRQNEAYMGLFKAFCERGDDDRGTKGD